MSSNCKGASINNNINTDSGGTNIVVHADENARDACASGTKARSIALLLPLLMLFTMPWHLHWVLQRMALAASIRPVLQLMVLLVRRVGVKRSRCGRCDAAIVERSQHSLAYCPNRRKCTRARAR